MLLSNKIYLILSQFFFLTTFPVKNNFVKIFIATFHLLFISEPTYSFSNLNPDSKVSFIPLKTVDVNNSFFLK